MPLHKWSFVDRKEEICHLWLYKSTWLIHFSRLLIVPEVYYFIEKQHITWHCYELFKWSPRPHTPFHFNIQFSIILLIASMSFKQIVSFRCFATELYALRNSPVHATCYMNAALLGIVALIIFSEFINYQFILASIYSPHYKIQNKYTYETFLLCFIGIFILYFYYL